MMYFESMADVSIHAKQSKPTRYEQFREQTATIDGLVEWCDKLAYDSCDFCARYREDDKVCVKVTDYDCKAGIKAYWEGEL